MFLNAYKQTFHIFRVLISQNVNVVIMRKLLRISFMWRRRYRRNFIFTLVYLYISYKDFYIDIPYAWHIIKDICCYFQTHHRRIHHPFLAEMPYQRSIIRTREKTFSTTVNCCFKWKGYKIDIYTLKFKIWQVFYCEDVNLQSLFTSVQKFSSTLVETSEFWGLSLTQEHY